MTPFVEFLNRQLEKRSWKPAHLSREAKIDPSLISKYLRGLRPLTNDAAGRLRTLLCPAPEDQREFDRLYEDAPKPRKQNFFRDLSMDSPHSEMRVATLNFPPFSGNKDCFLERCLTKMMELSVIGIKWDNPAENLPGTKAQRFSAKERIDWVETGKVDLLFNLVSLQRMKKLEFLLTPIRIGINGVMLVDILDRSDLALARRIEDAARLISAGVQPASNPFRVIVCRHEVGAVYMESNNRLLEIDPSQPENLFERCLDPVETIDPEFLAEKMRKREGQPVLLVCDEHTALKVVEELKGLGVLVLSPNSDQAVIRNEERRMLPTYYYGLGTRRHFNNPLIEFLRQNMRAFLAAEPENIAAWYELTYLALVKRLTACLSMTFIYVGGIYRTCERADEPSPLTAHPGSWTGVRKTMVEQNARAVARRCLNLSRMLLQSLPVELKPWAQIIKRARERIQITDGGDRGRIRNIMIYCAKMALCEDPLAPVPDPIELLRRLVPSYQDEGGSGPLIDENECPESPIDYWADFLRIMERELDTDLSSLRRCPEREFLESSDLGRIISRIQRLFESSRDSETLLSIRRYSPADKAPFLNLRLEYESERRHSLPDSELRAQIEDHERARVWRYIAYSLGRAVGFIEGVHTPSILYSTAETVMPEMVQIKHLHIARDIHKAGVSRRLIRRIIEEGNEKKLGGIWIHILDLDKKEEQEQVEREKFEWAGFVPFSNDRLWYELLRESGPKRLYPKSKKPTRNHRPPGLPQPTNQIRA
jgi:GNAT superfamily N-acetyltransferase